MTFPFSAETVAYKILTDEQLAELLTNGSFAGSAVDIADGYIHMSTAGQVRQTLDKHFAGQLNLHIAVVDLQGLGSMLKWEVSRGGALFPHLYAPLSLSSVIAHEPVGYDSSGKLCLPACSRVP